MNVIEIKNLSKCFGEKAVLKDISCQVKKGEIFGLLGPSGAGKTTLIKILAGQIASDRGHASVLNTESSKMSNLQYAQIGMVMDNSGLYERLSGYDNLLIFCRIFGMDKKRILEVMQRVDLLDEMKTPVSKFSKGMKQRLVLARAILHHPSLLFLDEPTSGLDPATSRRIHQLIYELREAGTTIFLTTHDMAEASQLCDNVALLNEGNIVEYGRPEEICRKYNEKNLVTILCKDGKEFIFSNDAHSSDKIAGCFREDNVLSIHSSEPNLETVFITLTGRGLI